MVSRVSIPPIERVLVARQVLAEERSGSSEAECTEEGLLDSDGVSAAPTPELGVRFEGCCRGVQHGPIECRRMVRSSTGKLP